MPDAPSPQRWELTLDGHHHRVEASGSVSRRVAWYVDDDRVAEARSSSDTVRLTAAGRPDLGAVSVRFSRLGTPRRATLLGPDPSGTIDPRTLALAGRGGLDLEPEPGSPAARHEDRVRASPQRYALLAAAGGVAKVVVPIILVSLFARFALSLPLPDVDLPGIPWPDLHLPSVPWPDLHLPSIPWPDWTAPAWLRWVLDNAHFVGPVIVAVVLARGEIRRRRAQDELRAARAREHKGDED